MRRVVRNAVPAAAIAAALAVPNETPADPIAPAACAGTPSSPTPESAGGPVATEVPAETVPAPSTTPAALAPACEPVITGEAPQPPSTVPPAVRRPAQPTSRPRRPSRDQSQRRRRPAKRRHAARAPELNGAIAPVNMPAFLLPIYQQAGARYGIRWELLAAVNEIETDFGRAMAVSSAGAVGWMQFMPATWAAFGVDANQDGVRDPEDPVDAIFAAARYLAASGAATDLRGALFAYNHAQWYVDAVLERADAIARASTPLADLISAIADGRFPVAGPSRWRTARGAASRGAVVLYALSGAPVVAVTGGRVVELGRSPRVGRYIVLEDASGTRFVYAGLGSLVTRPVLLGPAPSPTPEGDAPRADTTRRLFAHPDRPRARLAGGFEQLLASGVALRGYATYRGRLTAPLPPHGRSVRLRPLRRGSWVPGGTVLGRVGRAHAGAPPHLRFAVRPSGTDAGIDPRPLLDGWRLLDAAGALRPSGLAALGAPALAANAWSGQPLAAIMLADPRVTIYPCGREDIAAGRVDDRVLATLEMLADSGLAPTVSSLQCGHSFLTSRGTISEHSSGDAVDIAAVNGVPIFGHQGPGSITELTIRRLLTLQGPMRPHQIISLMRFPGVGTTLALADHADHIHVGFRPREAWPPIAPVAAALDPPVLDRPTLDRPTLSRAHWRRLAARLTATNNPVVPKTTVRRRKT